MGPAKHQLIGTGRAGAAVPAMLIVAAIVCVYLNALATPFVFDDHVSITHNTSVQNPSAWWRSMRPDPISGMAGRPLTSLSFALNYAAGGLNPIGYHLVNLALHATAALLALGILRRTLELEGFQASTAAWIAFAVVGIWAIHPLLTDTVTYVTQRTELLASLFVLLAIYCLVRGWNWAVVLAVIGSMLSKEIGAVGPVLIWLYDAIFLRRTFRRVLRRRPVLYAALVACWVIPPVLLLGLADIQARRGGADVSLTSWGYLKTQAGVLVHYLRLAFWPHPLVIDYYGWPAATGGYRWLESAAFIAGLLVITAVGVVRRRWWGFCGAVFFIVLAPTSSIIPLAGEFAAERRMYLPLLGLMTIVVIPPATWLIRRPALSVAMLILITLVLAVLTVRRNDDYQSPIALFAQTVRHRPDNARAWYNYGQALSSGDRRPEAIQAYRTALALEPAATGAHYKLGLSLLNNRDYSGAEMHLSEALRAMPDLAPAYVARASARNALGDRRGALRDIEAAARLNPADPQPQLLWANLLLSHGDPTAAAGHLHEAIRLGADDPATHILALRIAAAKAIRPEPATRGENNGRAGLGENREKAIHPAPATPGASAGPATSPTQ